MLVLLGLPAAVWLSLLADPLVATLFLSAQFNALDVRMAALSLMGYSAGLPAFMAIKVLAPAYHARHDARTPARFAFVTLGVNLVLSLTLMVPWGHGGLALATSLAAWVNAALLLWGLRHEKTYPLTRDWLVLLGKGGVATLILGALLYGVPPVLDAWLAVSAAERLQWLLSWTLGAAAVYCALLLAMGLRPRHFGEAQN